MEKRPAENPVRINRIEDFSNRGRVMPEVSKKTPPPKLPKRKEGR